MSVRVIVILVMVHRDDVHACLHLRMGTVLCLLLSLLAGLGPEAEGVLVERAGVAREGLVDLPVRQRCAWRSRDDHCTV